MTAKQQASLPRLNGVIAHVTIYDEVKWNPGDTIDIDASAVAGHEPGAYRIVAAWEPDENGYQALEIAHV